MTQIGINARPQMAVYLDGRPLDAHVNEIRVAGGFDVVSAAATITLDAIPGWVRKRMSVRVNLGYYGSVLVPAFNRGVVEDDGRQSWPVVNTIGAAGLLKRAQYKQKQALSWSSEMDETIVAALLAAAGIADADVEGDSETLGTVKALALGKGQAPIDLISRIDQTLGYKTFDTPSGVVQRRRVSGIPTAGAAYTYREADGNILHVDYPSTVRGTHNGVHVKGMPLDDGSTPNSYREAANPLVDGFIIYEFNGGEIIQAQALCDSVAIRLMEEYNREVTEVRLRVPGNPYLRPGMTIGAEAPSVGLALSSWWLRSYEHSWRSGEAISEMVLWGGLGDEGYSLDYGPHAQFSYTVTRATYGGAPMYIVSCDGSASWDPDDPTDTLTFAWENSKNAETGSDIYYATGLTAAQLAAAPTVTLTVTDPDGNTDSQTQEIEAGDSLARELYIAALGVAYGTPDGGATWNSWAPGGGVTVTATPRRCGSGWGIFGCSDGALVYTADHLATAPTTLHSFGSQITAIWLNEVDANRCLVALANGKIMLTDNLSLLAAATWTEVQDYGSPVRWVAEDPFNRGQIWVCVGDSLRLTFDEFATEGVRATFTGGTAARFQGSPFGNVAVGAAAEPCRDDTGAAHPYPVLDPVVSDVRGVAHHIRLDRIWSADYSGRFFEKAIGDAAWALVTTWAVGNVHDIMADGDEPTILYVGSDDGVYISADEGRTLNLMLDLTGAGLAAVQIGYGGLDWDRITALTIYSLHGEGKINEYLDGVALPADWETTAFDDSAWPAPVVQTGVVFGAAMEGCEWITAIAGNDRPTRCQNAYRRTFALSAGVVTAATLTVAADNWLIDAYINGTRVYGPGETGNLYPPVAVPLNPSVFTPGVTNCLALLVRNAGPAVKNPISLEFKLEVS